MSDSVPSNCPGTQSEGAGKASACAGCPNQKICSSGDLRVPDTSPIDVKENLLQVKNKIVVMSGKGGVGKSTVAVNLANAFCIQYPDSGVSLLDVDLCGPSIPKMTGTEGETMRVSGAGWSPVMAAENLSVVSIGYLLGGPDDAVIWRGPRKNGLIKQMLTEVDWCDQEWLIIDTPPGTSDEHLAVSELLSKAGISGIILVSTAQEHGN